MTSSDHPAPHNAFLFSTQILLKSLIKKSWGQIQRIWPPMNLEANPIKTGWLPNSNYGTHPISLIVDEWKPQSIIKIHQDDSCCGCKCVRRCSRSQAGTWNDPAGGSDGVQSLRHLKSGEFLSSNFKSEVNVFAVGSVEERFEQWRLLPNVDVIEWPAHPKDTCQNHKL